MGKIISVFMQKGGSAKTTTAINLSAFAGARKRKILLVDLDAQGSASIFSGINKNTVQYSIRDVLVGECGIKQAIQQLKYYYPSKQKRTRDGVRTFQTGRCIHTQKSYRTIKRQP